MCEQEAKSICAWDKAFCEDLLESLGLFVCFESEQSVTLVAGASA